MFLKIPEERVGVLIGKGGKTKKKIEESTGCRVEIRDNLIEVDGETIQVLKALEIVKAIGRGFSPENAFLLLNENYELLVISLVNETKNSRERIFGRIIGTDGKIRKRLEMGTNTNISVYGKTVSIIGRFENARLANDIIEMLIEGKSHAYAFRTLEKRKSELTLRGKLNK